MRGAIGHDAYGDERRWSRRREWNGEPGAFPVAPTYSQEEQPAYALTGNTQEPWPQTASYYQVGNDRIILPPTP